MKPDLSPPHLAILISLSGEGGVERMVLNLVRELAAMGLSMDLVLIREESRHLQALPENVNVIRLGTRHSALAILPLARYLRRRRPARLLAAKDRAGRAALQARRLAGVDIPVFIRLGTTLSEALEGRSKWRKWLRYRPMRRLYPLADGIIAVSRGVADDVRGITGLPEEAVHVVRNPVITADLDALAAEPVPHPWLADGGDPVIIGMGRLTRQKDFPTLLQAFAQVSTRQPARLIILGEGGDREALTGLSRSLGVADRVLMPGFAANPYAWLSRARLFVLSSAWEGSPNALTEAMALGLPVVATDCRSGPREILQEGRYGPLVPVGAVTELAEAMVKTLAAPLPANNIQAAVAEYRARTSAQRYLAILFNGAPDANTSHLETFP